MNGYEWPRKQTVNISNHKQTSGFLTRLLSNGFMFRLFNILLVTLFLLVGCSSAKPLGGGKAAIKNPVQTVEMVQSDNPAAVSKQETETEVIRTYTLPQGSTIERKTTNNVETITLAKPMEVAERTIAKGKSELGPAQKDMAREIGAKLQSLKGVTWLGVVLFILGIATFVWPPLRAVVGSITTSGAITLGGLTLIILPTIIVGHELIIMGVVLGIVALWFIAHRHGLSSGKLKALDRDDQWNPNTKSPKRF